MCRVALFSIFSSSRHPSWIGLRSGKLTTVESVLIAFMCRVFCLLFYLPPGVRRGLVSVL